MTSREAIAEAIAERYGLTINAAETGVDAFTQRIDDDPEYYDTETQTLTPAGVDDIWAAFEPTPARDDASAEI